VSSADGKFEQFRLIQARRLAGWDRAELADRTGLYLLDIMRWECNIGQPRTDQVAKLAAALDVPPRFFAPGRPHCRLDTYDLHWCTTEGRA
jgi:transcriptional regulator with XRE-family HTH domain